MRSFSGLLLIAALFLWAGLVAGISFLEAPLKFTAPHITVALGVGIGRVVFHALNKVEIVLCALAIGSAVYLSTPRQFKVVLAILSSLLLAQTFWLLPALDERATALLAGHAPPANALHVLYIAAEAIKLLLLLGAGCLAYYMPNRQPQATKHHLQSA
jgi:hypothetical protein